MYDMDKEQFLLYQTSEGDSQIEVKLQNDTVWLSLDEMAELFQRKTCPRKGCSRNVGKSVLLDLTRIQMLHVTRKTLGFSVLRVTCNLFHPFGSVCEGAVVQTTARWWRPSRRMLRGAGRWMRRRRGDS